MGIYIEPLTQAEIGMCFFSLVSNSPDTKWVECGLLSDLRTEVSASGIFTPR
jgi:hypothetical protein